MFSILAPTLAQLNPVTPTGDNNFETLINVLAGFILQIAVPLILLVGLGIIIFNGFKMAQNSESPEKVNKNRNAIIITFVAILLVVLSNFLVNMFLGFSNQIESQLPGQNQASQSQER